MNDEMSALTMAEKKEFFAAEDEAPAPMMMDNWNDEVPEKDFKLTAEEIAMLAYKSVYEFDLAMNGSDCTFQPYALLNDEMQLHIVSKTQYFISKAANPSGYEECAALHDLVLAAKLHEGWRYGHTLSLDDKVDPLVMPYRSLPLHLRTHDYLFRSVVISLLQVWRGN